MPERHPQPRVGVSATHERASDATIRRRVDGVKTVAPALRRRGAERSSYDGDRVALAAYLGGSGAFDQAIADFADFADFAETYADQNEGEYAAFYAAVKDGRAEATTESDTGPRSAYPVRENMEAGPWQMPPPIWTPNIPRRWDAGT